MKRIINFSLAFIILTSCSAKINSSDDTVTPQTPTTTQTITQTSTLTSTPTQTPTITPTPVPPCNDLQIGDLSEPGTPSYTSRENLPSNPVDKPLRKSLDYEESDYYVFQKEMHNRNVTVAIHHLLGPEALVEGFAQYIFDTWAIMWNITNGFPFSSYTIVIREPGNATSITWGYGSGFETLGFDSHVISHEIFHSFNPYYFETLSWLQEGLASYYNARLADINNNLQNKDANYFRYLEEDYNSYLSSTFRDYPLTTMIDADIENPDMNSRYDDLSYSKGNLVFYLLDAELKTSGHNLDEVVRMLYQRFGLSDSTRYISVQNFKDIVEEVGAKPYNDFFDKYINGSEPFPITPDQFVWICHDNTPGIVPLVPSISDTDLKFKIDGNADDWEGNSTILTDKHGDSEAGGIGDFSALYSSVDDHFLYIMIEAGKNPGDKKWSMNFLLDTKPGGECPPADLGISIGTDSNDVFVSKVLENCSMDGSNIRKPRRGRLSWDTVIEAAIPLALLGEYDKIDFMGTTFSMERDASGWYINADIMRLPEFTIRAIIPTPLPPIYLPQSIIKIDGLVDDWLSVEPVLTDKLGDSTMGTSTDIVSIYKQVDSNYLYLLLQTKDPITPTEFAIYIYLDLNESNTCSSAEIVLLYTPDRTTVVQSDFYDCQTIHWKAVETSAATWKNVVEIVIPLADIGPYDHIIVTRAQINAPIVGKWDIVDEVNR